MQVAKNRFDGELGVMLLKFDKESLSFAGSQKPTNIEGRRRTRPNRDDD